MPCPHVAARFGIQPPKELRVFVTTGLPAGDESASGLIQIAASKRTLACGEGLLAGTVEMCEVAGNPENILARQLAAHKSV